MVSQSTTSSTAGLKFNTQKHTHTHTQRERTHIDTLSIEPAAKNASTSRSKSNQKKMKEARQTKQVKEEEGGGKEGQASKCKLLLL